MDQVRTADMNGQAIASVITQNHDPRLDDECLALEPERIFYRCWNFAGHRSQFNKPGDFITCRVAAESIIVILDKDDELKAF